MSSEAPKSEQIQANVAAALSRLRGDLSTSSVSSAVVSLGVPEPHAALSDPARADPIRADPVPVGMPEMPGFAPDEGLQADPAMAPLPSGERRHRMPEDDRPTPLQRIAGLRIEQQPDLLSDMAHTPPPLADLPDTDAAGLMAARRRRNRLVLMGGVGAVVLIGAVWALMSGGSETTDAPPVITADATPEKVKPEDEGGMQVPNLNTSILDQSQPKGSEMVMPPPETPVAPPAPAAETQPDVAAPVVAAPDAVQTADASAAPSVAAPAVPDAPSVSAPDATAPAPAEATATMPATAAPEPAAVQTAAAPVAVPAGGVRIQFAAVKSEAAAQTVWSELQKKYPAVLGGLGLNVEKVDKGGSVLYRVQAGPFADKAAAKQACAKIKSQNQDCIVAH